MKFDDQLAAYLYEYKQLTLEGIGSFTLDENVRVPNEQEKEIYYPIEGLSFHYNPKAITDENLIFFLIKKLHKIEPLIRSDIESYLFNIKVFLNIGNPYTIEGIGTLNKSNQGIYEFTPGQFEPAKQEMSPKRENPSHNYTVRSKSSVGRVLVIILIVISALAGITGIGWGIYNLVAKQAETNEDTGILKQADTSETAQPAKKDSERLTTSTAPIPIVSNKSKDSAKTSSLVPYKMVFEITKSKERATSRTAQLNNLHSYTQYDSIPINDSVAYYRLFLPMKINPADTTHVKDSLRIFFGKKIFIEKPNE
ncbi:hypothetical protein [Segetibacter koreensis]|uniref:hypothetical protein n=1 Tax=Segetibacter koreensis TaxID=398037 RepID=UPI000370B5E3|nr:hypothetical protein [Segetibacter koreensis]